MPSPVRRIDIRANTITVQLDRDRAISAWRAAAAENGLRTERQIIEHHRKLLATGETITDDNENLTLTLPVRARFRGGAAAVLQPPGGPAARPDMALLKALARAHQWRKMLLAGEATSIEGLAKRFDLDRGHVGLTLNLAFLSPVLTHAIVRGEQPPDLRLTRLLNGSIPLSWREQEIAFLPIATACKNTGKMRKIFPVI
jgi:hypothetical protein